MVGCSSSCSLPTPIGFQTPWFLEARNQNLLDAGIIHKCISPWASLIVVVKKHTPEGLPQQFHLCIDYRKLNSLLSAITLAASTKKGTFTLTALPKLNEFFALLKGAKYFTALDLYSGYYHIKLDKESIPKRAFTTVFGTFDFLRLSRPRLLRLVYLWPFWTWQDV